VIHIFCFSKRIAETINRRFAANDQSNSFREDVTSPVIHIFLLLKKPPETSEAPLARLIAQSGSMDCFRRPLILGVGKFKIERV
jgi:hypothetical protein